MPKRLVPMRQHGRISRCNHWNAILQLTTFGQMLAEILPWNKVTFWSHARSYFIVYSMKWASRDVLMFPQTPWNDVVNSLDNFTDLSIYFIRLYCLAIWLGRPMFVGLRLQNIHFNWFFVGLIIIANNRSKPKQQSVVQLQLLLWLCIRKHYPVWFGINK